MNELSKNIVKGTFGELLVQLKLLQYGVQAAPPLKDSGNDLIAIRGKEFRAIQVKTRKKSDNNYSFDLPSLYHQIAIVCLDPNGEGTNISIDRCLVCLITREEYEAGLNQDIENYVINQGRVDTLYSSLDLPTEAKRI